MLAVIDGKCGSIAITLLWSDYLNLYSLVAESEDSVVSVTNPTIGQDSKLIPFTTYFVKILFHLSLPSDSFPGFPTKIMYAFIFHSSYKPCLLTV
jgi:hypothetical protein